MLSQEIVRLVNVDQKGIWVSTSSPLAALNELADSCTASPVRQAWTWDVSEGFSALKAVGDGTYRQERLSFGEPGENSDPALTVALDRMSKADNLEQFDKVARQFKEKAEGDESEMLHLVVVHDAHLLSKPLPGIPQTVYATAAWRRFFQSSKRHFVIVFAPPTEKLPAELEEQFWAVKHELPTLDELRAKVRAEAPTGLDYHVDRVAESCRGLTLDQAGKALALSLFDVKSYDPAKIWDTKAEIISKTSALRVVKPDADLSRATVGGMDGILEFTTKQLHHREFGRIRPKGVIACGVPGVGKSLVAKTLAAISKWPLCSFEMSAIFNSLVGDTEKAFMQVLDIAAAVSPCILWMDEFEKIMPRPGSSPTTAGGDLGGRLYGAWLKWWEENTSPVYVYATANKMSDMDGASLRRFDAVFFSDLPAKADRDLIWRVYVDKYLRDRDAGELGDFPDNDAYTGGDIEKVCRIANTNNLNLADAAKYVVATAVSSKVEIDGMREWANNKYLNARTGEVYSGGKFKSRTKTVTNLGGGARNVRPSDN